MASVTAVPPTDPAARRGQLGRLGIVIGGLAVSVLLAAGAAGATTTSSTTSTTSPTTSTTLAPHKGHKGHPSSTTTTTAPAAIAPLDAQQLGSLAQALTTIQQSESMSQRYDALVQQQDALKLAMAVSGADLAATRSKVTLETHAAQEEAVNSYLRSTPSPAATALFAGVGDAGASSNYASVAEGTTQDAVATLLATAARQSSELASQQADAKQIAANALVQQNLVTTAQNQARGALAVITTSTGVTRFEYLLQAATDARQSAAQGDASGASAALVVVDLLGGDATDASLTLALDESQLLAINGTATANPKQAAATLAALSQTLVPYHFGGEQPGVGFDCSGLTQWAWAQAGVTIPRTAAGQWHALPHVALTSLEPGDLLFYFNLDGDHQVDHVVMYLGSGPFGVRTVVAAPHTGSFVGPEPLFTQGLIGAARP